MKQKQAFTPDTRMSDLIHQDYWLIPVIGRFGIEFGFGNKTVSDVCNDNNINKWFFLEIVNSYHDIDYFPTSQLQNFSAKLIIQYLSNTHTYYLQSKIPDIQLYINEMVDNADDKNIKNVKLLNDFFKKYKEELTVHLNHEDKDIYPYILAIEDALQSNNISESIVDRVRKNSIVKYERNHDNIEIKLRDLKNLIIKFLPPTACIELCQKLLTELFRLEADIENHTRIEEKVLIPKVKQLEQQIIQQYGK